MAKHTLKSSFHHNYMLFSAYLSLRVPSGRGNSDQKDKKDTVSVSLCEQL